ncbi:eukaryotic translation initiation factor 4E-binding protein 1-like [Amphibalanus amphitrite]|uniref:eukaryotic translation initiation factor 4E-binding protein 1-like n=1 Tax=Amphibalanus amphitrite TaxID=1232801 RepID=UPI001C91E32E|nr:eukaryotic translation initiation factor 4E-binding protein 1-like [Amphibalanus amphitrite]
MTVYWCRCTPTNGVLCSPGTRIVYTGQFLKALRDSPLARTPPAAMSHVPGVTKLPADGAAPGAAGQRSPAHEGTEHAAPADKNDGDDPQFEMDM